MARSASAGAPGSAALPPRHSAATSASSMSAAGAVAPAPAVSIASRAARASRSASAYLPPSSKRRTSSIEPAAGGGCALAPAASARPATKPIHTVRNRPVTPLFYLYTARTTTEKLPGVTEGDYVRQPSDSDGERTVEDLDRGALWSRFHSRLL